MENRYHKALNVLCVFGLLTSVLAVGADYQDQANWPGACNTGSIQSPININTKMLNFCPKIGYYKLTLMCQDFPFVVVQPDDLGVDAVDQAFAFFFDPIRETYEAYQGYNLHFHTPSEHTINGRNLDSEMHIKMRPVKYDVLPPEALG